MYIYIYSYVYLLLFPTKNQYVSLPQEFKLVKNVKEGEDPYGAVNANKALYPSLGTCSTPCRLRLGIIIDNIIYTCIYTVIYVTVIIIIRLGGRLVLAVDTRPAGWQLLTARVYTIQTVWGSGPEF